MKQISTGTGLCVLGLGIAVLGAAQLIGAKGSQAFAQVGSERRVVNLGVSFVGDPYSHYVYANRCWSDGIIEIRKGGLFNYGSWIPMSNSWVILDNGQTSSFQPTDVDSNGTVDTGDISNVLLNYGATQEVTPVPTIECQTSTIP